MTIIEAVLETFPASKIEESPPKIETTPDQWERGRREITRAREIVIALIKANAEREETAKVQLAGQKAEKAGKDEKGGSEANYPLGELKGVGVALGLSTAPPLVGGVSPRRLANPLVPEKLSTGKTLLAEEFGGKGELSTGRILSPDQESLLAEFLEEIPPFDSQAFLGELEKEKEKLE